MRLELLAILLLTAVGCSRTVEKVHGGDVVHREKSMYRDIMVIESEGNRCMSFSRRGGLQSCVFMNNMNTLSLPYSRGVFAGLVANPGAKKVLVIGLGGGVIPRAIRRIDPAMQIDVIEVDPAVVKVAKRYFGYREDAHLRTHIGDGRIFVRRQARAGVRYDLIVIDAFGRFYVPEHMMTREFIADVKSLLAPGGVVSSNTFSQGLLAPYEAATYQAVFGEIRVLDMPLGSRILVVGRDGLPPAATLRKNNAILQPRLWKLGIFPGELDSHVQQQVFGYPPLTDQYSPANLLMGQ
jgi:spermidine synthase